MKAWFALSVLLTAQLLGCASHSDYRFGEERLSPGTLQITQRLKQNSYLFDSCRSVPGADTLQGTLNLRFKVRANGRVSDPHIFEFIGQSPELDRCLADTALSLQFEPLPTGLMAEVAYPIEFNGQGAREPAGLTSDP